MFKYIIALVLGIFAVANLIEGFLCGIDSNYIEGCYNLLSGCVLGEICTILAKD